MHVLPFLQLLVILPGQLQRYSSIWSLKGEISGGTGGKL